MYRHDFIAGLLYHFDFDPDTGGASNGSVVARAGGDGQGGFFDGTVFDADGHLWIAHWGGGCVSQWEVSGGGQPARRIRCIEIPGAQQITSLVRRHE
jgi:D-xylonolactonase